MIEMGGRSGSGTRSRDQDEIKSKEVLYQNITISASQMALFLLPSPKQFKQN